MTKTLVAAPAIAAAFSKLRLRLADTKAATKDWIARGIIESTDIHGYSIAPPNPRAGALLARFEQANAPLPSALEALYSETDGVSVGWDDSGSGGEQEIPYDTQPFMPLEELLAMAEARSQYDDDLILLSQPPDSTWYLMSRATGAVFEKMDAADDPAEIAASLVAHLQILAEGYGHT